MYLKQFASIKDDEINEIEKKLKVKFPKDYREFLLKYNGGIVEKNNMYWIENSFNEFIKLLS